MRDDPAYRRAIMAGLPPPEVFAGEENESGSEFEESGEAASSKKVCASSSLLARLIAIVIGQGARPVQASKRALRV